MTYKNTIVPVIMCDGVGKSITKCCLLDCVAWGFPTQYHQWIPRAHAYACAGSTTIFPADLWAKPFQEHLVKETKETKNYFSEIDLYSFVMPEYLVLTHRNAQIDDEFYWKNESGNIEAGLLNFAGIRLGSVPIYMPAVGL